MMTGRKVIQFAGGLDYLFNSRIAKFNYIPGGHINKMIVLHTMVRLLKLRNVPPKLVFNHQVAIKQ